MMLRLLARLLKLLNSGADPGPIALGLALSLIMGLTPLWSLHNVLVLLLVLILPANFGAFCAGLALFSLLAIPLGPLCDAVGLWLLTLPALYDLWTTLYNLPLFRLAHFNNSMVMGSLAVSLALVVPAYLAFRRGVIRYREQVLARVRQLRVVQALTASDWASRLLSAYRNVGN